MRYFGLIGKSLSHSFSKRFFTSKFEAEGIDAIYSLYELEDVSHIDALIAEQQLAGFNVTIPYKVAIMPYLDELTDEAREAGAVNCVALKQGRKVGHNTDIAGIEASLHWLDIEGCEALILGSGGASKAVQYVLHKQQIPFKVVSRDKERGDITYAELTDEIIKSHKLIINTTPLGMFPDTESSPEINYDALTEQHRVLDIVYNPAETLFLKRTKERGATTMGGMMMLQTQAIASWHFWNR